MAIQHICLSRGGKLLDGATARSSMEGPVAVPRVRTKNFLPKQPVLQCRDSTALGFE